MTSDDMIGAVYEGPLANPPWAATLPGLRRVSGARRIMLKLVPASTAARHKIYTDSHSPAADAEFGNPTRAYSQLYEPLDPVDYRGMSGGDICQLEDLIDRQTFSSSDYYRELCVPLGIEHAFFAYAGQRQGADIWLSGSRGVADGCFTDDEIAAVRQLLPHISRAAALHLSLSHARLEAQFYARTVTAMGVGVIMLDRWANIISVNHEADDILDGQSAVRRVGNRLTLAGAAQQAFKSAINQAARLPAPGSQSLTVGNGSGQVSIVIREASDIADSVTSAVKFIVYLKRVGAPLPERSVRFLCQAYGLSAAEARITSMLADGHTLENCAVLLGITPTSARTYCKRVFAKTGTSRQSELVKLVLDSLVRLG